MLTGGTTFYQPIFVDQLKSGAELYDTKYVRENSLNWEGGLGKVFQEKTNAIEVFESSKNMKWKPDYAHALSRFLPEITKQVYGFQMHLLLHSASMDKLSLRNKQWFKKNIRFVRTANRMVIEFIESQTEKLLKNDFV